MWVAHCLAARHHPVLREGRHFPIHKSSAMVENCGISAMLRAPNFAWKTTDLSSQMNTSFE